jgi:nitrogen regulatory protein P-II 1
MKLIVAIVRPFRMDEIVSALEDLEGFPGMTVVDSQGFGQRMRTPDDAINPFRLNKRIEIACDEEMATSIIDAIRQYAHTGKKGDGLIVVTNIEDLVMI